MQTIKNPKGQIYDFRSYIDVDLKKDIIESIGKIMQVVHQKFIENTGIKTSCFLRKIFEKFLKFFKISLYLYMYEV